MGIRIKMHKETFGKSDGFSLLEIVLALFVLAIGILGYMSLFGGSVRGAKFSRQYTKAVTLAESELDRIFNASYDSPVLSTGTHGPTVYTDNGFSANTTYVVTSGVSTTTSNSTIIYKRINFTVAWTEGSEPYSLSFLALKRRE